MDKTKELALTYFPFPEPRKGQIECICKIYDSFKSGKKFFILDAPTGVGKSAIATTLARMLGDAYYLTSTKILQDQINREFKTIIDLKGRNAYKCIYWEYLIEEAHKGNRELKAALEESMINKKIKKTINNPHLTCDIAPCKLLGRATCGYCVPENALNEKGINPHLLLSSKCLYFRRLAKAMLSIIASMNYKSFAFQTKHKNRFGKRKLLILDEGHNVEEQMLDIVSLSLTDRSWPSIKFKDLENTEDYASYFKNIGLVDKLKAEQLVAIGKGDIKTEERLKNTIERVNNFIKTVKEEAWIHDFDKKRTYRKLTIKPLFIHNYIGKLLFNFANNVLLMSATILNPNVLVDSLGINKDDVSVYRMKNRFPVKNRRIFYIPKGGMDYKSRTKNLPKITDTIDTICQRLENRKGIIHTHNFIITDYIINNISNHTKKRLLYQKDFRNKEELIETHNKSKNTVIIGPAMHEGLDLKDDLSRFAIICKIPFPPLVGDRRLKARMELIDGLYEWMVCIKLCQCYGRSIRSQTDYADTFIIDSNFGYFYHRNKDTLPNWFKEAIIW